MKKSSVFIYMVIIITIYVNVSAQITTTVPPTTTIPGEAAIDIGNGSGLPGAHDRQVEVILDNPATKVNGISMAICDEDDYLACSSLELTERSEGAQYLVSELENGCCQIVIVDNIPPLQPIQEGSGPIATIGFDVSPSAPEGECRDLNPEIEGVGDDFSAPVEVTSTPGEFCFTSGNTSIPTLSEWGIIIFMTIVLGVGVLMLYRRREI